MLVGTTSLVDNKVSVSSGGITYTATKTDLQGSLAYHEKEVENIKQLLSYFPKEEVI